MSSFDLLRPPSLSDQDAVAYKDWYHLNLFDQSSGRVALINLSLHGDPADHRSHAMGTALVHDPKHGWVGNVEVTPLASANISFDRIGMEGMALAVDLPRDQLLGAVTLLADGLQIRLQAIPQATPFRIELATRFGSGWIAWFALPRMSLTGSWSLFEETMALNDVSAYHDHSWGRWFWGDDIGWEWGTFVAENGGPVLIFSRLCNSAHTHWDPSWLIVELGFGRRNFTADQVEVSLSGSLRERPRRLPGALAALHQDWARPQLPSSLIITARSGLDWVRLEFQARSSAQLIAADSTRRGYAFVNELVGSFEAQGRVRDQEIDARGLAVFEYVQ